MKSSDFLLPGIICVKICFEPESRLVSPFCIAGYRMNRARLVYTVFTCHAGRSSPPFSLSKHLVECNICARNSPFYYVCVLFLI